MRVFLDTNVLASAASTRGLCADVLREILSSHELLISEYVLIELRRVLADKFRVTHDLIEEFVWLLHQDTIMVKTSRPISVRLRDKTDIPIIGAALEGGADILVTGDKELQDLSRIRELSILSPRQFWEELRVK